MGQKRKKIVFLSRFFNPHIGGVEKHVLEISLLLVKKGYNVQIITEKHNERLESFETYKNIKIFRIPVGDSEKKKKFLIWKWLLKNKKIFDRADIIHIHDVFFWILPLIIGLDRKKLFITYHGYENFPVAGKNKIQRKIAEILTSGNICVGDYIKKWYGTTPSIVTYGGVNIKKGIFPKKHYKNTFFFWGRLSDETGFNIYYKAYLKLKKEYKNLTFYIIGDKLNYQTIKGLTINSFKSDITTELNTSKFIFASGYLSMLEGMISKRLVFATFSNPLKKDYIEMSPFSQFVETCVSVNDLTLKVKKYINNPNLEKEKIEKAYDWAKKQTWEKVFEKYIALWGI